MHDLKFATDILNALKREKVEKPGDVVVHVRLSPFTHVTPEGLTETTKHLLGHEGFEGVKLDIKPLPYELVCRKCRSRTSHEKPIFSCPKCDSNDFDIIKEREFLIEGITR